MSLRERNKEERRQRILDAARRMLVRDGYRGLNVRALAKEAGVTQPTLYNLIGGKEQILFELVSRMVDVMETRVPAFVGDEEGDVLAFVERSILVSAELFSEDPDYYRAALIAANYAENQHRFWSFDSGILRRVLEFPTNVCRALAEQGLMRGDFAPDVLGEYVVHGFRSALRDWAAELTTLEEYRRWTLRCGLSGILLDAGEPLREMIRPRLIELSQPRLFDVARG